MRGNPEYRKALNDALDLWGEDLQIACAVEELSELTTELARMQRGREDPEAVVEEIADAQIMLDQLAVVFGEVAVDARIKEKADRLRDRVDDADGSV